MFTTGAKEWYNPTRIVRSNDNNLAVSYYLHLAGLAAFYPISHIVDSKGDIYRCP